LKKRLEWRRMKVGNEGGLCSWDGGEKLEIVTEYKVTV
jgi:hypothetical protein